MRAFFGLSVALILLSAGCLENGQNGQDSSPSEPSTHVFSSGFEPTVSIIDVNENFADIIGSDGLDWESDLEDNGSFGNFRIFYEGGDESQRSASIIEYRGGHVLEFRLAEANVNDGEKGRVSTSLTNNVNLTYFTYSIGVNMTGAFDLISPAEGRLTWMTIAEFWNDKAQTEHAFRITLAIHKEDTTPNTPLSWALHGQTQNTSTLLWDDVWAQTSDESVPIHNWFTLQVEMLEGDAEHGQILVKKDETILFDVHNWTHHPEDTTPGGFDNLNMMKLYTSGDVLSMLPEGSAFVILWDDFSLATNEVPIP
tara:strand:+ start:101 stop:1033 length:933 start_codon:yes stop_codon:yes gene_type:complete